MSQSRRKAFTLVELLVVIGIIAILISMLLPAVIAARRQMNLVKCASNLRQVVTGCMLHAHDHGGYLPLAGNLQIDNLPWTTEAVSIGLNDHARRRYSYAKSPAFSITSVIVPLPAAIGPYLGLKGLAYNDWYLLDQQLNDHQRWRMFICPMAADKEQVGATPGNATLSGQGTMMAITVGSTMTHVWSSNADYAFNEAILGYDYRPQYMKRRLGGNMARITRPAEMMLMCDAKPAAAADPAFAVFNFKDPWITFAPSLTAPGPITLADALANNANVTPHRATFDKLRHKGRLNVAFADGHVEALEITPKELEKVYLCTK